MPQLGIGAFAQRFGAMQRRMRETDIRGIPQGRAALRRQRAMVDFQSLIMPERITQVEKAPLRPHRNAFFEGALAIGRAVKGAIPHEKVATPVKSPFLIE